MAAADGYHGVAGMGRICRKGISPNPNPVRVWVRGLGGIHCETIFNKRCRGDLWAVFGDPKLMVGIRWFRARVKTRVRVGQMEKGESRMKIMVGVGE